MKKIILASPRGFCAGVDMAIESLNRALEIYGTPIYVFHEIVHNRTVVNEFREKGAVFVNDVSEVPEGATLLFSAHGISPTVRNEAEAKKLRALDATCPLVTKVHLEALKFAKEGFQMVLVGHEGHDEVIGTMGEVPDRIHLIESASDVEKLSFPPGTKLAYLTQTTLSVDDANIVIKALKDKFPEIVGPAREDICYATQNRQEAVRTLAAEADLVIVLGSQNSSNSLRLSEIATQMGIPSVLVDRITELDPKYLENAETILVTAGASAPESLVQECVEFLKATFGAEVESRTLKEERITFALPKGLRSTEQAATV